MEAVACAVHGARSRGTKLAEAGHTVVGPGDVIYVAPRGPHPFRAPTTAPEPFGFLFIVNAERDRPVPVDGFGVCDACV